jgi:hypothetical protein
VRRRAYLCLFAGALAAAALPTAAQKGVGDVVYVPTPQIVVDTMMRMAQVGPGDYLIDLGSGDGRVVVSAASRGARALGVDLDRHLLGVANDAARREGVADRASFREQNLFETDLAGATVITTYLLPDMNLKLRPKILALKPGTRVVAHDYHMGDWLPDQREALEVPEKKVGLEGVSYVYLWHVPAQVAGRWRAEIPVAGRPTPFEFELEQRFQVVTGHATAIARRPTRLQTPRLRSDALSFTVELGPGRPPVRYEVQGRVEGDDLRGTAYVWENNARREVSFAARRVAPAVSTAN